MSIVSMVLMVMWVGMCPMYHGCVCDQRARAVLKTSATHLETRAQFSSFPL